MQEIIVDLEKIRIDTFLSEKLNVSRSKISKMLENNILVNDNKVKNSYTVKLNDVICVTDYLEENLSYEPEDMNLNIVYEDDDVIVVNKENGVVVHPAIGNTSHTLVNGLMFHSGNLSSSSYRPGIVHRIDAYTTGLLMVAKNDSAHENLSNQLALKTVYRKYIAIVWGVIKNDTGTIDAPIGRDTRDRKKMGITSSGKEAITHFQVLKRFENATLIELRLETGRTHQIRVHMNYIGFPIVNDPVYGKRKLIDGTGQCLHAKELGFIHPKTNEQLNFNSEIPECFANILKTFEENV